MNKFTIFCLISTFSYNYPKFIKSFGQFNTKHGRLLRCVSRLLQTKIVHNLVFICCRYYPRPSKFCFVFMLGKNNCSVTMLLLHSFFFIFIYFFYSSKKVETCCWENYKQHKEKQEKLKNFKLPGFEQSQEDKFLSKDSGLFEDVDDVHSWWSRYQPKVWKSLEEPYTSFWAKVRNVFLLIVDNGVDLTGWKLRVLPERVIYFLLFSD